MSAEIADIRELHRPITASLWVPPPSMINDVAITYFEGKMMEVPDTALIQTLLQRKYSDQVTVSEISEK